MVKQRLRVTFVVAIVLSLVSLVSPARPAAAANNMVLDAVENTGTIHVSGAAYFGGNAPAVMSTATSSSIAPYTYGPYTITWIFTNPMRYSFRSVTATYLLGNNPTQFVSSGFTQSFEVTDRRSEMETFISQVNNDAFHKKWVRVRMDIKVSDGSTLTTFSAPHYYISDGARNEIPKASIINIDNTTIPPNTPMLMAFNQWTNMTPWISGSTIQLRSMRVLRCTSRPTENGSTFLSNAVTPTGCTRLVTNPAFDPLDNQAKSLSFTSGAAGSFIYAIDTVAFNNMPAAGDVVYLQKRSIYSVAAGAGAPPATATPSGAVSETTVPATSSDSPSISPLESAGINLETASVVTASGQVLVNGVTLNLKSKTRFKRSKNRHNFVLSVTPQTSSAGKVTIALVKKKKGVDFVYKKASKVTRGGRAIWKWNFATKLPAGRYRFYVTFTPSDTTLAPITLSRFIRLL